MVSFELLHARRLRGSKRLTRGVKGHVGISTRPGAIFRVAGRHMCHVGNLAGRPPHDRLRLAAAGVGVNEVTSSWLQYGDSEWQIVATNDKRRQLLSPTFYLFRPPRAERQGFEPWEPVSQLNSLAVSPIRPLSHLSSLNSVAARGSRNNTRKYRLTR